MTARVVEFSTRSVADPARLRRWEDWNRAALIGLECRTPDGRGLRGTERTLHLPDVTVGLVSTGAHTVRRSVAAVESSPADALVLYAVLRGRSTFADHGGERTVAAGDVLIADPDRPFARALPAGFRELVIKVPRRMLDDVARSRQEHAADPRRAGGLTVTRLRAVGRCLAAHPGRLGDTAPAALTQVCLDLMTGLTVGDGHGDRSDRHALAVLLIDQQLHTPQLSAASLAEQLGIGVRQLSRLFADRDTTLPQYVARRRIERARGLLAAGAAPVGEIAAACGFASAAYFSRVFTAAVGRTPSAFRAAADT